VQLMYIGDRLGLFRILSEAASGLTATELAAKAGCHVRYVETWCQGCVAHSFMEAEPRVPEGAALLEDGARRYWMTAAQREVLAYEDGRHFQCGAAQLFSASAQATPAIMERGFKSAAAAGGVSWEELGSDACQGVARMSAVTLRDSLPGWVTAIPEAKEALAGPSPRILDVGCGFGASTFSLAAAFPSATVVGLDPDPQSVAQARMEMAKRPELQNACFEQRGLEDVGELAGAGFDVILAYDCLHDMPNPSNALELCCRLLRRSPAGAGAVDGVLLWFEPHGSDDPYENREILGARMTAGIALNCVTTSMAMGGAGLGAHGCTPRKAEALARAVGFRSFRQEQKLKGARYRNNVYVLQ